MQALAKSLLLLTLVLSYSAASDETRIKHDHVAQSDWGIDLGVGYATIQNPLTKRDDLHSVLLPQWYYYGERVYIETTDIGFTLFENNWLIADIVGYLNQDGVLFNTDGNPVSYLDISNKVPNTGRPPQSGPINFPEIKRHFSYMAGGQLLFSSAFIDAKVIWGKDISVGHDGEEFTLALEKRYYWQDWKLHWEFGGIAKTAQLNNYYYGLRASEAGLRRDSPVTKKMLKDYYAKVALAYRVTDAMSAVLSLQYTNKASELLITPLLQQRGYYAGFIGINYHF